MRWPWHKDDPVNGQAAALADAEVAAAAAQAARRRLRKARNDWPQVNQTRDVLAEWIDLALRGKS